MRALVLLLALCLPSVLAGCVDQGGPVGRDDLAFPVVSSLNGVNATDAGELELVGADGVLVTPGPDANRVTIGLAAVVQSNVFQACRGECRGLEVLPGTVVAETHLASLRNVSLNAAGPDGDSAVFFYDAGVENGRFLRWSDAVAKFQMNGDLQAIGNLTATHHVGTVTPLTLGPGTLVTVSTAALEGLEVAIFARGSGRIIEGNATITLPPAFTALALDEGLTAQVTLRSPGPLLYVREVTKERLVVSAVEGTPSGATFDYFIQAKRKGGEGFEL